MGRAMLIICSAVLVSMGFISIGTSNQGKMLTEKTVNYADFTMAKNTAHTAIQMAMQEINENDDYDDENSWINTYDSSNPWSGEINGRNFELYVKFLNKDDPDREYWDADSVRIVSKATHTLARSGSQDKVITAEVVSLFLKERFSSFVPDFTGALQLPTNIGDFNVDGAAHEINGIPSDPDCSESKPPIAVNSSETKDKLENSGLKKDSGDFEDDDIQVDSDLDYEPTDELIERLENSGNSETIYGDKSTYGSAENPGVFFVDGDVKLKGNTEGFGILVIRGSATMEMEDDPSLSVAGNFTFNGLVIFENAELFDGRGTPTINGSVLIGNTGDYEDDPIDINLGGDIEINYDCKGEDYAKKAAADAVKQNKYTRVVTSEGVEQVL